MTEEQSFWYFDAFETTRYAWSISHTFPECLLDWKVPSHIIWC